MYLDNQDPYFQDVPWELIFDDEGKVIGEIYLILHPPRRATVKTLSTKAKKLNPVGV